MKPILNRILSLALIILVTSVMGIKGKTTALKASKGRF